MKLTDRDIATLRDLSSAERGYTSRGEGWCTPLDIGGRDGSHHSRTLTKLARHGLVERQKLGWHRRGSCMYRTTEAGRAFLASQQEEKRNG